MKLTISFLGKKHNTEISSVNCDVIPLVGEEVFIGDIKYVVKYRSFDIINAHLIAKGHGQLICTGLVLEE